jgi:hypothetical protein
MTETHSRTAAIIHQQTPTEARMLETYQAAEMVHRLPKLAHDPSLPGVVQQACVEAFFLNVRALIEFLEIKGRSGNAKSDFFASDVAAPATWSPVIDGDTQDRLGRDWIVATRHLMHFSKERVSQSVGIPTDYIDVSEAALVEIADDLLGVWDQFAAKVNSPLAPKRAGFALFSE